MQCLLAEKVALAQSADELFLVGGVLADGDAHLPLRDDEERVAAGALPDDVVALLVVALLQDVGNLAQRVLRQVLEDGNAVKQ